MFRIPLFLCAAAIISLPVWTQVLPAGIAAVVWLLVCALAAAIAVWGESGARDFGYALLRSLREQERDRDEVLRALLSLAKQSRLVGLQGLADVESNWGPLRRASLLIASVADSRDIYDELRSAQSLLGLQYEPLSHRLRWLASWSAMLAVVGAVWMAPSGEVVGWALGAGLFLALLLITSARIKVIADAEAACVTLAYEGAVRILQNNSVEFVFQSLVSYLEPRNRQSLQDFLSN